MYNQSFQTGDSEAWNNILFLSIHLLSSCFCLNNWLVVQLIKSSLMCKEAFHDCMQISQWSKTFTSWFYWIMFSSWECLVSAVSTSEMYILLNVPVFWFALRKTSNYKLNKTEWCDLPESGLPSLLINSCMRFSSFCWRLLFITTSGLDIVRVKLVSGISL